VQTQNLHQKSLCELIGVLQELEPLLNSVENAGNAIVNALKNSKKLLTAGNGGSAADALHLAEELVGRFEKERLPLPAICLASDPTLLTCIGNDYGFEFIFSRQIQALGSPGDVLVVFSTSGNSNNLNLALDIACKKGLITIALLGKSGGAAKGKASIEIIVPSANSAHIQEVHTFILHCWLRQIEMPS
jgi:D-sedoheptulose 7-phosphate isomerase